MKKSGIYFIVAILAVVTLLAYASQKSKKYSPQTLRDIVSELDNPLLDPKEKMELISRIKGSPNPETKKILKDLAMTHYTPAVRDRAALALLNCMTVNTEPSDKAFISDWVKANKDNETGYWAVTSIRVSHGTNNNPLAPDMAALLIDVLRTSKRKSTRQEAARTLGRFKAKEALLYFEECSEKDKDSTVRGECQYGYWAITGKIPPKFNTEDVSTLEEYYRSPDTIAYLENHAKDYPDARFGLALKHAIEEYRGKQK